MSFMLSETGVQLYIICLIKMEHNGFINFHVNLLLYYGITISCCLQMIDWSCLCLWVLYLTLNSQVLKPKLHLSVYTLPAHACSFTFFYPKQKQNKSSMKVNIPIKYTVILSIFFVPWLISRHKRDHSETTRCIVCKEGSRHSRLKLSTEATSIFSKPLSDIALFPCFDTEALVSHCAAFTRLL